MQPHDDCLVLFRGSLWFWQKSNLILFFSIEDFIYLSRSKLIFSSFFVIPLRNTLGIRTKLWRTLILALYIWRACSGRTQTLRQNLLRCASDLEQAVRHRSFDAFGRIGNGRLHVRVHGQHRVTHARRGSRRIFPKNQNLPVPMLCPLPSGVATQHSTKRVNGKWRHTDNFVWPSQQGYSVWPPFSVLRIMTFLEI